LLLLKKLSNKVRFDVTVEGYYVLTARGLSSAGLVHRIEGNMFTSDDEKRFGTSWTP
jgi:hypothetical protein